jgi:hypothetical protein
VKAYGLSNAQWTLALSTLVGPITPPDSPQNQFGLETMSLIEHLSDSLGAHLEYPQTTGNQPAYRTVRELVYEKSGRPQVTFRYADAGQLSDNLFKPRMIRHALDF